MTSHFAGDFFMESSSPIRSKKPVLESNTINAVPESARHGAPSSQFTLWLSANLQITAVVDGALAIIFGSEAMSAIIGLLIGNIGYGIALVTGGKAGITTDDLQSYPLWRQRGGATVTDGDYYVSRICRDGYGIIRSGD